MPGDGRGPQYAVGLRALMLVDNSRQVSRPAGGAARDLPTYVRYPAAGPAGAVDVPGAPPAASGGPFPLIVFGHGFAQPVGLYAPLLRALARAGYVVAAPVFPLENPGAPGGPDESDLINEPGDVHFVISELLAANAAPGGPLSHLIDPRGVAVAGQSDGGDTALALAYDRRFRDPRVRAAAVFSGAAIPGGGLVFAPGSPPLLAVQGTADAINLANQTLAYYRPARRPKYLLSLLGAGHLQPYSTQQPQLGIVERVSTAFFDLYLKHTAAAAPRLRAAGRVAGIATLDARS